MIISKAGFKYAADTDENGFARVGIDDHEIAIHHSQIDARYGSLRSLAAFAEDKESSIGKG